MTKLREREVEVEDGHRGIHINRAVRLPRLAATPAGCVVPSVKRAKWVNIEHTIDRLFLEPSWTQKR
jgi:hypothetical protein